MNKIKLVNSLIIITMIFSIASMNVVNAFEGTTKNEKTFTKEEITSLQSIDLEDIILEKNLQNTFANDIANARAAAEANAEQEIVLSSNDSVKITKKNDKKKKKKKKKATKKLGEFKITGYCSCSRCCGKSNGITASGTKAKAGRTIAADTSKLPFGTKVVINGHTYTVEDRGGAINGNKIDIFFSSHNEALQWGVRYCDVYLKK